MPRHLVIIDPGIRHPEIECTDWIQAESPMKCAVHYPALEGTRSLWGTELSEVAGVIILGSGASPEMSLSWQTDLKRWLTHMDGPLHNRSPMLGICYGHQLIAHIFGEKTEILWDGEKASGLRQVSLIDSPFGVEGPVPLVVSHREGFRSIPSEWRSMTRSEAVSRPHAFDQDGEPVVAVEAMAHERHPWWGFQAHIEAVEGFMVSNQVEATLPDPYAGHELVRWFLNLI
jgi:GMP synthase-like glutamine amidotransferase